MTRDTDELARLRARVEQRRHSLTRQEYRANRGRHPADWALLLIAAVIVLALALGWRP